MQRCSFKRQVDSNKLELIACTGFLAPPFGKNECCLAHQLSLIFMLNVCPNFPTSSSGITARLHLAQPVYIPFRKRKSGGLTNKVS